MSMHDIVRPWQNPNRDPVIVPAVSSADAKPARLKWGEAGTLPSPVSAVAAVNLSEETYTETSRKTHDVTIQDQNNPANQIIERRTDSINLDKSSSQNVLQSTLASDVDTEFNHFSTEIKNAFQPFDPDAKQGTSKVTWNFKNTDS